MENVEENNKLIAEFMGNLSLYQILLDPQAELKTWRHADYRNFTFNEATLELPKIQDEGYPNAEIVFVGGVTKFHSSWNWLMPVIEKIEFKYEYSVSPTWEHCIIQNAGENLEELYIEIDASSKIEATYKAVIEFIKWYNKNKK